MVIGMSTPSGPGPSTPSGAGGAGKGIGGSSAGLKTPASGATGKGAASSAGAAKTAGAGASGKGAEAVKKTPAAASPRPAAKGALPGKSPGAGPKGPSVMSVGKSLTDPSTSAQDKAMAGATAAVTAVASAAASPVAGKVVATLAGSKGGQKVIAVIAGIMAAGLLAVVVLVATVVQAASMVVGAGEATVPGGTNLGQCASLGTAAALTADQQANATAIVTAVTARGLAASDAAITIMTALTESGLNNVDHGDLAGPDSRGLFQQRDSWGTPAQRMDPATATGFFLDRMTATALKVYRTDILVNASPESRDGIQPWMVAQSVQISAFATGSNYQAQYVRAVSIVTSMLGSAPANAQRWADSAGLTLTPAPVGPVVVAAPVKASTGTDSCVTDAGVGAWGGFSNGKVDVAAMQTISWAPTQMLRPDAAAALEAMNKAYSAVFSVDITITDSYRDLATQVATKAEKGHMAATPGTSNHGWGLAVDLGGGINQWSTLQRIWMVANAPAFGWESPAWAQPGRGEEEPWHWEFNGKTTTLTPNGAV